MAVRYQMAVGLNKGHKVTKVDNPRKLKPSYRKGVSNYLSCHCRDMVRPKMATFQMRIFISSPDFDGVFFFWFKFLMKIILVLFKQILHMVVMISHFQYI
jgi:hypothetical protein